MSFIKSIVDDRVTFTRGLTGNYYFISTDKQKLINICKQINKSINSVYFSSKYQCYCIRLKHKEHKMLADKLFRL